MANIGNRILQYLRSVHRGPTVVVVTAAMVVAAAMTAPSATAGTADHLAFSWTPGTAQGGSPFDPQPVVQVEDANNAVVSDSTATVALAITPNSGAPGAGLTCSPTAAASGIATFSGCSIDKAGTGYTLDASSSGLNSATSASFDVVVGPPSQILFTTQPSGITAGHNFSPDVAVELADAGGNAIDAGTTQYSLGLIAMSSAHLPVSLSCSGGETAVSDDYQDPNTNNIIPVSGYRLADSTATSGTFQNCTINGVGTGDSLYGMAIDANQHVYAGFSASFDVAAGSASKLAFTSQPVGGGVGQPLAVEPVVAVQDDGGNTVTSQSATALTLSLNGPNGHLACDNNPVNTNAGVATFSGCSIDQSGNYTMTASGGNLTTATSQTFVVSSGTADGLTFTTPPSGATGGQPFTTQPVIEIDNGGLANPVAGQVRLTLTDQSGGSTSATLTCPNNPAPAGNGVAQFYGCRIDKAGGYRLVATAVGTSLTASAPLTVTVGSPSQAVFSAGVPDAVVGASFGVPTVTEEDAGGNHVTSSTGTARLLITPGTGAKGATLSCPTNTVSISGGSASFGTCRISPAGQYQLTAVTPAGVAISNRFAVAPGAPAKLAFLAAPSTYLSGGILDTQPQVVAEDSAGNILAPSSLAVTLTAGGGSVNCAGARYANGVASFSGCVATGTGTITLTASSGSLTSASTTIKAASGLPVGTGTPPSAPVAQTFGTGSWAINAAQVVDDVNSATGSLQLATTDLTVAGIGEPLAVTRTYASLDRSGGSFGPGWTSIFDAGVTLDKTGLIATLRTPDGQQAVYKRTSTCSSGNCLFPQPPGAQADVSCNKQTCTATRFDGTTITSTSGKITNFTAPNGDGLAFTYTNGVVSSVKLATSTTPLSVAVTTDAAGHITQLKTPTRTVSYSYSGGLLTGYTDPAGNATSYAYDSSGRLTAVSLAGPRLRVTYDSSGRVATAAALGRPQHFSDSYTWSPSTQTATRTTTLQATTPSGGTATSADYLDHYAGTTLLWEQMPDGAVSAYSYDAQLRLLAFQAPGGGVQRMTYSSAGDLLTQTTPDGAKVSFTYDTTHDVTTSTDQNGNVTSYQYVAPHRLSYVVPPDPTTTSKQPGTPGAVGTHYVYNNLGEIVQRQTRTTTQTFIFDNAGNQSGTQTYAAADTTLSHPLNGSGPLIVYDEAGNKTAVVAARGHNSDGSINAAFETTYSYDADENKLSTNPPNRDASTATYDAAGAVASVQNAGHPRTSYSWAESSLTMTATTNGVAQVSTYDAAGNLLSSGDVGGHATAYAYDTTGREISETDPANITTTYSYNAAGDVATSADTAGHQGTFTYDAMNRMLSSTLNGVASTKRYDPAGNVVSSADPSGLVTSYAYNNQELIASVGTAAGTTSYRYDQTANLVATTDGNGHAATYTYDPTGVRTTLALAGSTWRYGYDIDGNLISTTDPDGRTTAYTLNGANDTTRVTYSQSGQPTITVTQTFDGSGRRTSMTDPSGTHNYTRDAQGNLVSTTGPGGGFGYDYSTAGQMTETYPDGTIVKYALDDAGNVMSVSAPHMSVAYLRNDARQITGMAYGNGIVESRKVDATGRLLSQQYSCGGTPLGAVQYGYDANGNPLASVSTVGGLTTTSGYGYDSTGRVVAGSSSTSANTVSTGGCTTGTGANPGSPAGNDGSSTTVTNPPSAPTSAPAPATLPGLTGASPTTSNPITYDHVGNRTSAGGVTFGYNAADELSSASDGRSQTYDNAGDLTSSTVSGATTSYRYDAADHLIGVTKPDGTVIDYSYDGDGNRLTKAVNGTVVERYSWDTSTNVPVLAEITSGSGAVTKFFYGASAVAMQDSSGTYYFLTDARADVTALADATGAIVATYVYDAFGKLLPTSSATSGAPAEPILFEGQFRDSDTGLYDLRARNYDPTSGRFTQRDPTAAPTGTPAVSPYVFTADQPTVSSDPTGAISDPLVSTGHSTETANTVTDVQTDAKIANIGAKVLVKVGGKLAGLSEGDRAVLGEGASDAGKLLGVVGIGLGIFVTVEDCMNGPLQQCVADAVGVAISAACLVGTEGVGALACAVAGAAITYIIANYGPQIAGYAEDLLAGVESCADGPSARCIGATIGVAVGAACAVVTGGALALACGPVAVLVSTLIVDYGPEFVDGLETAGGVIASGFNQLGSAVTTGYEDAVATLEQAGLGAEQLAFVLRDVFAEGADEVLDQLIALSYDVDSAARALEDAYNQVAAQTAALLDDVGYAVDAVASGLHVAYSYVAADVAAALAELGHTADQIIPALQNAFHATEQDVANALSAVDYGAGVVGAALTSAYHQTAAAVVGVLKQAGYTAGQVASWLSNQADYVVAGLLKGAGYLAAQVAGALEDVFNDTDRAVAQAMQEVGYLAQDVAGALKTVFADPDQAVALALNAAGYAIDAVSAALQTIYGDTAQAAAAALKFAGYAADQIATTLTDVYNQTTSQIKTWLQDAGFSSSTISAIGGAFSQGWSEATHYLNPANWF